MPTETLELRQELFCQEYVKDANGARAARAVGYAWDTAAQQASRMLRIVKVQNRLAELRTDLCARHEFDRDTVMTRLEAIFHRALKDGHYHAAVRATALQARLAGLEPDRDRPRAPTPVAKDASAS
jgi:phage terminase small subunit